MVADVTRLIRIDEDGRPTAFADLCLERDIAAVLVRHYPGHPWLIQARHDQGIATIRLGYGFLATGRFRTPAIVLHINDLKTDPTLKAVERAGGEWLERYRLGRRGRRPNDWLHALENGLDTGRAS